MKIRHLIASILVCTLPFAISCEGPEELTPEENGGNTETQVDPDDPSGEENPGEEDPQPEEPEITHYTLVAEAMEDWSGEYLIAFKDSERILVFGAWDEDTYGQPASENGSEINFMTYLEAEGIPVEKGDPYRSVIEKVGSHYSINVSNVGYIGYTGSKNSLSRTETAPTASDTEYLWDITYSDDIRLTNAGSTDRRLQWNNSAPRFVAYKGSQQELTLYRKGAVSGLPVDPGTDPDDPGTDPDDPDDPAIDPDNPDPDPDDPVTDPDRPNDVGWFELPVITDEDGNGIKDDDNTLYYAYHLCDGNETYGSTGRKARNYTVCYSAEHHCPLWVAAPRHDMYVGSANRTDAYQKDPKIPASIQYNSKSIGGGCNKGHMLGSAERTSSSSTNRQVFYYTNIAPQLSKSFNTGGGAWNNLENLVDGLVCRDTLYEVVGCYFETYTDAYGKSCSPETISFGGRDDVTRPSMYYYVLLRTKDGNTGKAVTSCSASELQCVAFVIRHNMEKGHKPQAKDMMSVSDLEKITGVTYFANVPNAPKDTFNASDWL